MLAAHSIEVRDDQTISKCYQFSRKSEDAQVAISQWKKDPKKDLLDLTRGDTPERSSDLLFSSNPYKEIPIHLAREA